MNQVTSTPNTDLLYQYCPKVAIIDRTRVLLAKRQGEADLDGALTLVGGKIEHSDTSIVAGITRELREEIGADIQLDLLATYSIAAEYTKADGNRMILPHFLAEYVTGEVHLNNEEYATYTWAEIDQLDNLPGVLPNIGEICRRLLPLRQIAGPDDYVNLGPTTQ
jgi:8-oxo-dGTP pyrophosphatase MutT (NUDIX family)